MPQTQMRPGKNTQERSRHLLALACCVGLLLQQSVLSQEPESPVDIIEQSVARESSSPTPASPQNSNNLSTLFYELQLMQNEVMKLRGELEELGHRLDELSRQQSAQYMDINRRLSGSPDLSSALPEGLAEAQAIESIDPAAVPEASGAMPAETEEGAYRQAFALIQDRQFERAVGAFDQFLLDHPNGEYTPNAFYWLGELHLQLDDLEKSRQSFVQVLTLFPEARKVPDALYKLGVVYDRLDDRETADQYLRRVLNEYPSSTAAGLSREHLDQR